ncbi:MAG: ATP-binding protein [Clostridiaceae bacterium]|nr:ATP-binding protein [Clostridiaceae bacterium]
MYLNRTIEKILAKTSKHYPVILVTGPRQVGKTTVLQEFAKDSHQYITMDNLLQRGLLETDPYLFFKNNQGPLILDEIQYVPGSFQTIKEKVDENGQSGFYLLTGSQSFHLMKNVSETLAGRIAIFQLQGLSLRERYVIDFYDSFIPNESYILNRKRELKSYSDLWNCIHRGSMPKLVTTPDMDWDIYYQSYIQTYIERDVRQLTQIGDEKSFMNFMISLAARSAEILNYQSIAKDIGVSSDTIKRWTSILETSGIIYLLYPYSNNHLKRVIKTPKVYFMDTGLLAYLTRWLTAETLQVGAVSGNVYETFVIVEIIKSFLNVGNSRPPIYYYRDRDGREIDLIIEDGHDIYPVEIKKTAKPEAKMAKNFSVLQGIPNKNLKTGVIICQYDQLTWLKDDLLALPIEYI